MTSGFTGHLDLARDCQQGDPVPLGASKTTERMLRQRGHSLCPPDSPLFSVFHEWQIDQLVCHVPTFVGQTDTPPAPPTGQTAGPRTGWTHGRDSQKRTEKREDRHPLAPLDPDLSEEDQGQHMQSPQLSRGTGRIFKDRTRPAVPQGTQAVHAKSLAQGHKTPFL